jgi:hypothetical protein
MTQYYESKRVALAAVVALAAHVTTSDQPLAIRITQRDGG